MTTSIDLDFTKEEASSEDLQKVKEISQMLKLSTRRPSVIQWKQVIIIAFFYVKTNVFKL